jgi:uncharacterized protein
MQASKGLQLSKDEARRLLLAHQCLWPPRRLKGESGALAYVRRVRCIQYDPLNIVGRNPELVLQSRVRGFRPAMMERLLYSRRELVDGWDKQMSIYPAEDWPFFARRRKRAWPPGALRILSDVRKEIRERGPLSSIDLEHDVKVDWAWGPARMSKALLETMFWRGELVIHHRVNTRRIYDLSSRHLPASLLRAKDPNASEEAYHDWHVLRRLRGVGLGWARSSEAWLGIPGVKTKERAAALSRLCRRGSVVEAHVEGIDVPLFMATEESELLHEAASAWRHQGQASVIAPLDNLLWDRGLMRALFDFDYVWEVYKPRAQRRHGYYVLPILYGERFVARFEPGKGGEGQELAIKNWWWEEGVRPSDPMREAIVKCFKEFLRYLGATRARIEPAAARRAKLSWLSSALHSDQCRQQGTG